MDRIGDRPNGDEGHPSLACHSCDCSALHVDSYGIGSEEQGFLTFTVNQDRSTFSQGTDLKIHLPL